MNASDNTLINQGVWQKLFASDTDKELCFNWLVMQCGMMDEVLCAAVYLGSAAGSVPAPTAIWPENFQHSGRFDKAVSRVLAEGKCFTFLETGSQSAEKADYNSHFLGCPCNIDAQRQGVVVFQVRSATARELQIALHQVKVGVAWLENLFLQRKSGADAKSGEALNLRLMTVFDIVAATLEETGFKAAATVAVTELATRIDCERVSIGFVRKNQATVTAISHSVHFGGKTDLVTSIGAAMDESIDQVATVVYPPPAGQEDTIQLRHGVLHRSYGSPAILTVPFLDIAGTGYGALTFERAKDVPFDNDMVLLCEAVAALLGPILKEKKLNDLPLYRKAGMHFVSVFRRVFGPGHQALKFVLCCLAGLLLFLAVANGDYRISASSFLEGTIQGSVSAPFDGYLLEAPARAGDIVAKDQILASLDIRDLLLQRLKWASQQKQYALQFSKALSQNNIADSNIIREQMSQAESEVLLLDEQIERARIRAPFAGLIISGDLSQSIGAPLDKGQTLYQVAPLDSFRVMLEVSEEDIDQVAEGQQGELVLNAIPNTPYLFRVEKITPVSTTREERNFFLVEGRIIQDAKNLRPGMQGFGKIYIARRKLVWIWMHDFIDWMRVWFWTKFP